MFLVPASTVAGFASPPAQLTTTVRLRSRGGASVLLPVATAELPWRLVARSTAALFTALAVAKGSCRAAARAPRGGRALVREAAVGGEIVESSRVVAVVGRDGAGKSKVCAALLDIGNVAAGSERFADKKRLLETDMGEPKRNFSCYNHFYSQRANGPHLHLVDTPGHVDRMPLVDQALHAAHGAVMVCSIRGGVDAACGRVLAAVEHSAKPYVIFLNGVDKEDGAPGFTAALDALERRLGVRPVVLFAPAHVGGVKEGRTLLNVLNGTLCTSAGCELFPITSKGGKKKSTTSPVPMELYKWAQQLKEQVVETLAGIDDELMEVYFEQDGNVPRPMIDAALSRAVAAGTIAPLVAGSAKTGLGIDALQEVVKTFIPAGGGEGLARALAIDPARCEDLSADAPCLGWVFGERRAAEGRFLEVRVLGGTLRPNESLELVGVTSGGLETFTPEHLRVHGLKGELMEAQEAGPGDIALVPAPESVAVVRPALQDDAAKDTWMRRGRCTFALKLEGLTPEKRTQLTRALEVCLQDNDGLRLEVNTETGEHLLSCMGMLHLELLRERLSKEFHINDFPLDQPHVAYHVRLNAASKGDNTPKKNDSGWANVELVPAEDGRGCEVQDDIAKLDPSRGGKVTPEAAAALEPGLLRALRSAGPGGSQVVDVTVKLLDASASSVEEAMACTRSAVEKAISAADITLLEPFVEMEIDAPLTCVGPVLEDLRGRRGEVLDTRASQGENQIVIASVPLAEILDYTNVLSKLTADEGFYTFRLEEYQAVTSLQQKRLVAELA